MTGDYTRARCAAITKAGKRCSGVWSSAVPILFAWDPDTGAGMDGPWCVLCHRHRHWGEHGMARYRVVHGWLGPANTYGYGRSVWSGRHCWTPAPWWFARRKATTFGGRPRRDAA